MTIAQSMQEKLTAHFSPSFLRIINDSTKHAGHLPEDIDESHLGIIIVSDKFTGLSRVARSREVHAAVAEEIAKIHALTVLKTLTPDEYAAQQASL
jgi:BolA protein